MSPPGETFKCTKCEYQCGSRRVLASHESAVHSDKVFKCPHCPFVSRYQANFYRHRRIVHKIGRTTCNICNQDCETVDGLLQHKQLDHGQGLEEVLNRYQKDKDAACRIEEEDVGESDDQYDSYDAEERARLKKAEALYFSGFGYEALEQQKNLPNYEEEEEENGNQEAVEPVFYSIKTGDNVQFVEVAEPTLNAVAAVDMQRTPLKVKRHYTCKDCNLQTLDPREFLYHRKEFHFDRITVHECPYCIYATKHFQKLQRHCGLVHKNNPKPVAKSATDPSPYKTAQAAASAVAPAFSKTARKSMSSSQRSTPGKSVGGGRRSTPPAHREPAKVSSNKSATRGSSTSPAAAGASSAPVTKQVHPLIKCTRCDFQCKSRVLMSQHEKTVHLRKRFFRCLQCGYVTNERGRYTKHVKYHSLPKIKCEECDFYTTYKWNMDRHMKSHEMEGPFRCGKCTFTANNRQSLTFHLAKHHNGGAGQNDHEEDEEDTEAAAMMEDDDEMPDNEDDQGDEEEDYVDEDDVVEVSNENSLEDFLGSDSHLSCRFCSFKTYSKSTLLKHEESHGSSKRYPCPLCGVSFDHVAWLAKHLTQKHGETADTKDLSRAAKEIKRRSHPPNIVPENRQRVGGGHSSPGRVRFPSPPSSPPVLKVNKATKSFVSRPSPPRRLKEQTKNVVGPRAKKSLPKKAEADSPGQGESTNGQLPEESRPIKYQHSCNVCNYKTKWLSEMEKHVRVHSLERPFGCPSCKYRCKWKGDLKRHVIKYHDESLVEEVEKMKTPVPDGSVGFTSRELDKPRSKEPTMDDNAFASGGSILKMKLQSVSKAPVKTNPIVPGRSILKPARLRTLLTQGRTDNDSRRNRFGRGTYDSEDTDVTEASTMADDAQESDQGDLVIDESYGMYEPNVVYNGNEGGRNKRERSYEENNPPSKKFKNGAGEPTLLGNKKYKCTFCPFMSRTASRFHVHIVQHLNKKPFMCSTCFYRSNWEWDITKHIKIKSVRDEAHRHASMLVTDESGRKNYEKYNRFLVDDEGSAVEDESQEQFEAQPESPKMQEDNTGEYPNYLISPEDVETIVVTPDLGGEEKEDQVESIELDLSRYFNSVGTSPEKPTPERSSGNQKFFYCRHCNFKNGEKKAVVGHLSLHAGTKPFQCRICGMVSNWKHVILRHVKMRHGGTLEDVKNRLNYTEHDNVIELVGYPELNAIKPKDSGRSQKTVPVASSTPKSDHQFQCEMCPYTCEKLCYMHFHVKQHQPREGANFKCPHCDYWVNFKKTLNRHLKVHDEEKEPQMPQIAYYETATNFGAGDGQEEAAVEMDTLPEMHPITKKFQCEFCPYSTDKKRHFLYHKQFHRPNKAALFKCEYCSYWAMHNHLITQHTKKCHTENVYGTMENRIPPPTEVFLPPSPMAGVPETATVVSNGENEILMVEQNGKMIKMIKCRFCPMMNRRRSNVRSHEEMHSYEKHSRFPCTVCNYQCNSQGVLTSHMKLHASDELKHQELEAVAEQNNDIDFDFLNQETFAPKSPPPTANRSPVSATPKRSFSYFCAHCPAMFKSRSDYQTHSTFHGTNLPFPCDRCDYRARHKPHLHKHFVVHSEEYMARREAAQPSEPPPTKAASPKAKESEESEDAGGHSSAQMSSVNQMLLLEERETAMFLEKGVGKHNRKTNQCPSCPATFQKPSVLSFHKYLHGVSGKYYCPHCDYSVNDVKNLKTHQKLHPVKVAPQRTVLKIFACSKCPAVFTKNNRYLKHIDAHGKDNKFRCERCDFSVNLLIQLVKHRNVHKKMMEKEAGAADPSATATATAESVISPEEPLPAPVEVVTAPPVLEKVAEVTKPEIKEKVTYCCNRCPYFHARRDAMINHHKRHTANAVIQCPHCDYSTLQASFLRDHIKWHFQPQKLIKANSFMKYSELEVWSVQEGERFLLFKDNGEDKENDRFFSPVIERNDSEDDVNSIQGSSKEVDIDKSKQLEVVLTDVFNPSVKKRLNSENNSAPRAKRQKIRSSEESDGEARLVIDTDRPPVLRNEMESKDDQEEYVHEEYEQDEGAREVVTPATVECGTCPFVCPYEQRGLMQIHRNSHKPRQSAHFKCPHCPYWVNHRKTLRNHLRLHERQRRQTNDEAEQSTENVADTSSLNKETGTGSDQGVTKTEPDSEQDMSQTRANSEQDVEKTKTDSDQDVEKARTESEQGVEKTRADSKPDVEKTRPNSEQDVEKTRPNSEQDVEKKRPNSEQDVEKKRPNSEKGVEKTRTNSEKSVEKTRTNSKQECVQATFKEQKPKVDNTDRFEPEKNAEREVDDVEQIEQQTKPESIDIRKETAREKSTESRLNPEDEQEVIDAVENMLQETQNHRYHQVDFEERIEIEQSEIAEDATLPLENEMGNEETVENGCNSNDDGLEDIIIESQPITNGHDDAPDNASEEDAEGMEVSISGDGRDVEHSYAEFPETPENSESRVQSADGKLPESIDEPPILEKEVSSSEGEREKKESENTFGCEDSISSTLANIESLKARVDAILEKSKSAINEVENDASSVFNKIAHEDDSKPEQHADNLKETDKSIINKNTPIEETVLVKPSVAEKADKTSDTISEEETENGQKENTSTKDIPKQQPTRKPLRTSSLEVKDGSPSKSTKKKSSPKEVSNPEKGAAKLEDKLKTSPTILEEIFLAEEGMVQEDATVEDEEDDESHIDMDDLVVHEDTEEDNEDPRSVEEDQVMDFEESFVGSDSKEDPEVINMDDLVVHDESEDESQRPQNDKERPQSRIKSSQRQVDDREIRTIDVNLNQEAIIADDDAPVAEFNEEEVNAADQEASDILMNMASDYFSADNGEFEHDEEEVEPILDNPVQGQDELEPWNGEMRSKSDVLANLLLNAGVYTDDD